jgi:hypothetical protein
MLRYTDVAVEGAPPAVALGTAIGALRGLIVDYLWIKIHLQKQKGLYYEVMADADLITKLQPRFSAVWAFHGHNMAYNISVAHNTEQERWEWVSAGIDLVRNRGLRYNPNDLQLHRELAFWFAHKIEGSRASPTTLTSTTSGSSPASGTGCSGSRRSITRPGSPGSRRWPTRRPPWRRPNARRPG